MGSGASNERQKSFGRSRARDNNQVNVLGDHTLRFMLRWIQAFLAKKLLEKCSIKPLYD